MALTVQDLTKLQCFSHIQLVAGEKGIKNKVNGVGILDYELMPEYIDSFLTTFSPGDFILCSFLYQYCCNRPEEILPMVKELQAYGASALGCKKILYPELPAEVLEFAEQHSFPIFQFGKEVYYENIIYEVSDALQKDDRNLLTTENIDSMILGRMPKNRIYTIAKTLSLSFKEYCRIVYISQDSAEFRSRLPRYCRSFYLNRNIGDKAMVAQYQNGLFIILTAAKPDERAFDVLLDSILGYMGIETELYCCKSRLHKPFDELDLAFRESYRTYAASLADLTSFESYDDIGVYQLLLSGQLFPEADAFTERYIAPLADKPDYLDTLSALVRAGGDIAGAAAVFGCHPNTIRYKLARIRELTSSEHESDNNFYMNLCLAFRIYRLRQVKMMERILI